MFCLPFWQNDANLLIFLIGCCVFTPIVSKMFSFKPVLPCRKGRKNHIQFFSFGFGR